MTWAIYGYYKEHDEKPCIIEAPVATLRDCHDFIARAHLVATEKCDLWIIERRHKPHGQVEEFRRDDRGALLRFVNGKPRAFIINEFAQGVAYAGGTPELVGCYSVVYSPDDGGYYAELWWRRDWDSSPVFADNLSAIKWAQRHGGTRQMPAIRGAP